MGLDFIMPQTFLERALAAGGKSNSELWSKRQLTWRILPRIDEYSVELGVHNPSDRDRLAMAELIADRFDQYGHFRPEMIERWAAGQPTAPKSASNPHELWQRRLWTQLQQEIDAPHPALELAALRQSPDYLPALRAAFPKILVLGTGVIDPLLAQMLRLMGQAGCDARLHIVLPSMGYLGELRSQRGLEADLPDAGIDPEALPMHDGHPLLVSMGRHAVGSFLLLGHTLDEQYTHWPEPSATIAQPHTLLGQIQADIRELRRPATDGPSFKENALCIHSCFGPRREMEALRDELLRAFHEIPDLKPEEVHVVTPSLETYGPLVAAILEQGAAPLPTRLTELPPSEGDPVAEGLLALLDMARRGRFEASEVLGLLHLRAVHDALGMGDDQNAEERARNWIKRSGLTQGLGSTSPGEVGTWDFARDRLIAGRWLGPGQDFQYTGAEPEYVLPVADALSGDAEFLETFLEWHARLAAILLEWQQRASPAQWSLRLKAACDQVLSSDADARLAIQSRLNFLAEVPCDFAIDCGAVLDWLQSENVQSGGRALISGKITVGRFKQLQNIPCRVLAIVGLQDGQFPRQNRVPAWDLLQLSPKAWDRNPRVDDRQVFLDALLTPTDRLILTASTQNVRSGKTEPFSSCVDELLRAARDSAPAGVPLIVKHRLQPFASGYFSGPGQPAQLPASFDQQSAAIAAALAAGADAELCPLWQGAASEAGPVQEIALGDLIDFWKNPAKSFLRAQGIALARSEENDEDFNRAPLSLDGLQEWALKHAIFSEVTFGASRLELARAQAFAQRQLPPRTLGVRRWLELQASNERLGNAVKERGPKNIPLDLSVGNVRIGGSLRTTADGTKLLGYRVGQFKERRHHVEPWIHAVAAACAGHDVPTELLDDDSVQPGCEPALLLAIEPQEARAILSRLVEGYLQGQSRPICYAPAAADCYAKSFAASASDERALASAKAAWSKPAGHGARAGEGFEEAAQIAWRDRDPFELSAEWQRWSNAVAAPLRSWVGP